jgi:hypothetical protein
MNDKQYQLTAVMSTFDGKRYVTEPMYIAYGDTIADALEGLADRIPQDATFVRIIVEKLR